MRTSGVGSWQRWQCSRTRHQLWKWYVEAWHTCISRENWNELVYHVQDAQMKFQSSSRRIMSRYRKRSPTARLVSSVMIIIQDDSWSFSKSSAQNKISELRVVARNRSQRSVDSRVRTNTFRFEPTSVAIQHLTGSLKIFPEIVAYCYQ